MKKNVPEDVEHVLDEAKKANERQIKDLEKKIAQKEKTLRTISGLVIRDNPADLSEDEIKIQQEIEILKKKLEFAKKPVKAPKKKKEGITNLVVAAKPSSPKKSPRKSPKKFPKKSPTKVITIDLPNGGTSIVTGDVGKLSAVDAVLIVQDDPKVKQTPTGSVSIKIVDNGKQSVAIIEPELEKSTKKASPVQAKNQENAVIGVSIDALVESQTQTQAQSIEPTITDEFDDLFGLLELPSNVAPSPPQPSVPETVIVTTRGEAEKVISELNAEKSVSAALQKIEEDEGEEIVFDDDFLKEFGLDFGLGEEEPKKKTKKLQRSDCNKITNPEECTLPVCRWDAGNKKCVKVYNCKICGQPKLKSHKCPLQKETKKTRKDTEDMTKEQPLVREIVNMTFNSHLFNISKSRKADIAKAITDTFGIPVETSCKTLAKDGRKKDQSKYTVKVGEIRKLHKEATVKLLKENPDLNPNDINRESSEYKKLCPFLTEFSVGISVDNDGHGKLIINRPIETNEVELKKQLQDILNLLAAIGITVFEEYNNPDALIEAMKMSNVLFRGRMNTDLNADAQNLLYVTFGLYNAVLKNTDLPENVGDLEDMLEEWYDSIKSKTPVNVQVGLTERKNKKWAIFLILEVLEPLRKKGFTKFSYLDKRKTIAEEIEHTKEHDQAQIVFSKEDGVNIKIEFNYQTGSFRIFPSESLGKDKNQKKKDSKYRPNRRESIKKVQKLGSVEDCVYCYLAFRKLFYFTRCQYDRTVVDPNFMSIAPPKITYPEFVGKIIAKNKELLEELSRKHIDEAEYLMFGPAGLNFDVGDIGDIDAIDSNKDVTALGTDPLYGESGESFLEGLSPILLSPSNLPFSGFNDIFGAASPKNKSPKKKSPKNKSPKKKSGDDEYEWESFEEW